MKENSGYIPSMLDLGTFIGAILIGYLGDRLKKRSLFLAPFIFFSSIMMLIATLFLSNNPLPYFLVIFLIGMGLGGPYNIIGTNFLNLGTIIAIDLASQKIISTITAVVDACGALFAAFTQLLLAHISHRWIFTLFTIYTLCAGAVLVPLTIEDYKIYRY
jgi:sugar phosphate permease